MVTPTDAPQTEYCLDSTLAARIATNRIDFQDDGKNTFRAHFILLSDQFNSDLEPMSTLANEL